MTKKLEDLFNLESNQDTPESLNDKIENEQDSKDDAQANAIIQEKFNLGQKLMRHCRKLTV